MLGPGIICATVPVTMGYSIHSFRKAGDKGWALLALLVGAPMSLLVLWVAFLIIIAIVTGFMGT